MHYLNIPLLIVALLQLFALWGIKLAIEEMNRNTGGGKEPEKKPKADAK